MEIYIFAFSFEAEMVVWQEAAEKAKAEGAPEPGRPRGLPRIGRRSLLSDLVPFNWAIVKVRFWG